MEFGLNGKRALVTGASHGLGKACAQSLAQEGADLAICSRNKIELGATAEEITRATGGNVIPISADLTSKHDLDRLAKESIAELGAVDILVLSTGHPPTYAFSGATDEHWEMGIDLLLRPPITLTRHFLEGMKERKFGRIILIGSIYGIRPEVSSIIQSTLRRGLTAFAKCVADEVAPLGITINVICPGYFETPLVSQLAGKYAEERGTSSETILEEWKNYPPSKRMGKPEELGALVSFLASTQASLINGSSITINA